MTWDDTNEIVMISDNGALQARQINSNPVAFEIIALL
jgi:hypothetical protein